MGARCRLETKYIVTHVHDSFLLPVNFFYDKDCRLTRQRIDLDD